MAARGPPSPASIGWSRTRTLAEVFLSGLLERSDPEHHFFDFAPGVRKTLLATIRRSDAARIVDRLDEWIARNLAVQPASFQRFIESAHGYPSSGNSGGYLPFAGIPHEALEAIGGSYAEAEPAARKRCDAAHQFLLADNSLFVLPWNNRLGWEQGRLRHWLDLIKARAPRSPVLLLDTHLGPAERTTHLPLEDLKREYPQISASISIDNETGAGFDALRSSTRTTRDCPRTSF
jgi:hypothetical protein